MPADLSSTDEERRLCTLGRRLFAQARQQSERENADLATWLSARRKANRSAGGAAGAWWDFGSDDGGDCGGD